MPFDELTAQLEKLDHKLRQALPRLEQLSPTRLHRLRITAKKLRYLTEFIAGRYDAKAIEDWLDWLKKAQTVFGVHNDRVTARAHIETLSNGMEQPGKLQHSLQAALREQNQPELSLPALPEPYWRS